MCKQGLEDIIVDMNKHGLNPSFKVLNYCEEIKENAPKGEDDELSYTIIVDTVLSFTYEGKPAELNMKIEVTINEVRELLNIEIYDSDKIPV